MQFGATSRLGPVGAKTGRGAAARTCRLHRRKDLNNCYYKKPDADIYIVTALPEDMDDDPEPLPPQPGCPKLKPVKRSECPDESKNELVYFFSCDDVNLKKGDWCKANRDECGVSTTGREPKVAATPRRRPGWSVDGVAATSRLGPG